MVKPRGFSLLEQERIPRHRPQGLALTAWAPWSSHEDSRNLLEIEQLHFYCIVLKYVHFNQRLEYDALYHKPNFLEHIITELGLPR